jgi:hypothetical protein
MSFDMIKFDKVLNFYEEFDFFYLSFFSISLKCKSCTSIKARSHIFTY